MTAHEAKMVADLRSWADDIEAGTLVLERVEVVFGPKVSTEASGVFPQKQTLTIFGALPRLAVP